MKRKYYGRYAAIAVAVSALSLGSIKMVHAAGPVAVAPQKSAEVIIEKPSSPVKFTLGVGAGYLTGEAKELVYWPEFNNHKASELTWKIDNLFMIGVNGTLEVGSWFVVSFDGWFKATDGEGTMDDYDWQVPGASWTDWSHHEDTDVTDGSIIDINAAFTVWQTDTVRLKAIAGLKQDKFGWESRGGDYTYSVNGFRDTSGSFTGGIPVISYEQTMSSLYAGIGIGLSFDKFLLDGRIIYSPFVTGEATDNHHLRNLVTYDDFENGDMIAFELSGTYFFTPHLGLEASFSHQSYDTMQGDSEWHFNDEGVVYFYSDGAGMDHSSTMLSCALRYAF